MASHELPVQDCWKYPDAAVSVVVKEIGRRAHDVGLSDWSISFTTTETVDVVPQHTRPTRVNRCPVAPPTLDE